MQWVTRARPKVDRIACPWLVERFVDPQAEFVYVPSGEVAAYAERTGAIPYDILGRASAGRGATARPCPGRRGADAGLRGPNV